MSEPVATPSDRALLHGLLDEAGAYDAEYGARLSNHLPMAWLALARLGAGEARLREFGADYIVRRGLVPARSPVPWPAGDAWAGRLGDAEAWPMLLDLFQQWITHEGAADVLAQVLPALMPGVGAAAFHGLIRTAAGVQAGHAGEVAQGLAHWAAWHLPFGVMVPLSPAPRSVRLQADPVVLLRQLRAGPVPAGLIADGMKAAAAGGEVNAVAACLAIDDTTPERLARAAAFAYSETGNFTALHLVTGTHAMRLLVRFIDEDEGGARLHAWRWFWQAYAHGVVAARLRPASKPVVVRPWAELVAAALASRDEHVIKLVDAAREEGRHYSHHEEGEGATGAVGAGGANGGDRAAGADGRCGDVWQRAASRAVM